MYTQPEAATAQRTAAIVICQRVALHLMSVAELTMLQLLAIQHVIMHL